MITSVRGLREHFQVFVVQADGDNLSFSVTLREFWPTHLFSAFLVVHDSPSQSML